MISDMNVTIFKVDTATVSDTHWLNIFSEPISLESW
jgi:hypothetical protein